MLQLSNVPTGGTQGKAWNLNKITEATFLYEGQSSTTYLFLTTKTRKLMKHQVSEEKRRSTLATRFRWPAKLKPSLADSVSLSQCCHQETSRETTVLWKDFILSLKVLITWTVHSSPYRKTFFIPGCNLKDQKLRCLHCWKLFHWTTWKTPLHFGFFSSAELIIPSACGGVGGDCSWTHERA